MSKLLHRINLITIGLYKVMYFLGASYPDRRYRHSGSISAQKGRKQYLFVKVWISDYLSLSLTVSLSENFLIHCLSIPLSVYVSVCLCLCISVSVSLSLYVYLSVCLSVSLSRHLTPYFSLSPASPSNNSYSLRPSLPLCLSTCSLLSLQILCPSLLSVSCHLSLFSLTLSLSFSPLHPLPHVPATVSKSKSPSYLLCLSLMCPVVSLCTRQCLSKCGSALQPLL